MKQFVNIIINQDLLLNKFDDKNIILASFLNSDPFSPFFLNSFKAIVINSFSVFSRFLLFFESSTLRIIRDWHS